MIRKLRWREQNAVCMENDFASVVLLPGLGGKITSLFSKGSEFELAAQTGREYRLPGYGGDFSHYDASGLDDGFPCLHAANDTESGWKYPDHGEIWSAALVPLIESDCVYLRFESRRFPYRYEKRLSLRENMLAMDYRIENTGESPFPCIWAFHGLMRYEEDMQILYPKGPAEILNTLDSEAMGAAGKRYPLYGGHDFVRPPPQDSRSMVKYYLLGRIDDGCCGIWYPSGNTGFMLRYDAEALPYFGVWITAGGFRGDYNCALEPCNGFYDDIPTARRNNALYMLEPGRPLEFSLAIEVVAKMPQRLVSK